MGLSGESLNAFALSDFIDLYQSRVQKLLSPTELLDTLTCSIK